MYGLSVGVSHIGETLPRQAYALLSELNAAIVVRDGFLSKLNSG